MVDATGAIYVTGWSENSDTDSKYLTIKYITCSCPHLGDPDGDGFATSIDLSLMIDALFAGGSFVHDPVCPVSRIDYDCDGQPTALDLSQLIDHLFAGGAAACDPCPM